MGFYENVVFPRLMDRMMSAAYLEPLRSEVLSSASGRVLELGFGTGLNLAHYPDTVSEVVGVDPNPGMTQKAEARIRKSPFTVERVITDGESLDLDSESFDTVVSTWTLCTVADVKKALAELRRVMKPQARLLVLEHGLADDPGVQKWQRRLNGVNRLVACGCNLDRDVKGIVEQSGFEFAELRTFYLDKEPKVAGFTYLGSASIK